MVGGSSTGSQPRVQHIGRRRRRGGGSFNPFTPHLSRRRRNSFQNLHQRVAMRLPLNGNKTGLFQRQQTPVF